MTVLVTGSQGFLGAAVVRAFGELGADVVSVARRPADGTIQCDVGDPGAVVELLESTQPMAIVNCAVVADFGSDVLDRLYPVDALAPAVLARWSASAGAHLVQVSGSLVHGARTPLIGPTSPLDPDTDYGRAKLLGDEMVLASGCPSSIVRFGGIYGAGGPSHLGLNRAIDGVRDGEVPVLHGDGTARRNYVHVADAAAMLRACVTERILGVHLAAGPETLSIADMLEVVCEVLLPGSRPGQAAGSPGSDQVIEHSPSLPSGRPMAEALAR